MLDAHFGGKLVFVACRVHGSVNSIGIVLLRIIQDIFLRTLQRQLHPNLLLHLEALVVSLRQLLPKNHPVFLHSFLAVVLVLLLVQNPLQNALTAALVEAEDSVVDDLLDTLGWQMIE